MLELLVENKLSTSFILIEDSSCTKAEDLLLSFVTHHAQDASANTSFFCFENPVYYYSEKCKDSKITYYDCFTNLHDWQPNFCNSLENHVVFIDSLSVLIMLEDFINVYRYIFNLSKKAKKIIVLIHGDVITNKEILSNLSFLAMTIIKVNKLNNYESKTVEIKHKKPGGKVVIQNEEYSINPDFKLSSRVIHSKKKEKVVNTSETIKSEMKNLSTFDIGLNMSENEKLAKRELILPYMRNESTEESGKIIYEPDAGDDLEEDPDDDLDI